MAEHIAAQPRTRFCSLLSCSALMAITLTLVSLTLATLTLMAFATPARAEDDLVYVQTRNAAVLAEPKLLSKVTRRLSYGDSLLVISRNSSWLKVRTPERAEGFIHLSAVSSRRLTLSGAKGATGNISDPDISLAGKGFSPEVERQLASQNQNLNFRAVDAMEKISISSDQTRAFIKNGKLNENASSGEVQ